MCYVRFSVKKYIKNNSAQNCIEHIRPRLCIRRSVHNSEWYQILKIVQKLMKIIIEMKKYSILLPFLDFYIHFFSILFSKYN